MIAQIPHTEGDPSEPVTRGEFDQAMSAVNLAFQQVATKDDLKGLESRMEERFGGVEGRIGGLENEIALLRNDIKGIHNRFDELFEKIDVAVEDRFVNLGAARKEEVMMIRDKQERHEERITALEAK